MYSQYVINKVNEITEELKKASEDLNHKLYISISYAGKAPKFSVVLGLTEYTDLNPIFDTTTEENLHTFMDRVGDIKIWATAKSEMNIKTLFNCPTTFFKAIIKYKFGIK
ncbi:hypothetical protein A3715_18285 [Oleiphilus sp. HI0009]|nr:hypothetical protein A3715_18285 [Oleiphilus sp. HI0009]